MIVSSFFISKKEEDIIMKIDKLEVSKGNQTRFEKR